MAHHFDFSFEWFTGNKDEQIEIGLSPSDENYPSPYLYMNPWPFNEKMIGVHTNRKMAYKYVEWYQSGMVSKWNGVN
jgi:hypothetical protein